MAEDHVGSLRKARDELVRQHRLSISALKGDSQQNMEHHLTALIRYQKAIEAIDSAITEEQHSAEIAAGVQSRSSIVRYEDRGPIFLLWQLPHTILPSN
jgi:hypothetical protein